MPEAQISCKSSALVVVVAADKNGSGSLRSSVAEYSVLVVVVVVTDMFVAVGEYSVLLRSYFEGVVASALVGD